MVILYSYVKLPEGKLVGGWAIQQHATFDHGTHGTVEDSQKNPGGFNTLKFNQKDDVE